MTIIQAIVLGLVQGLTEYIPISSTAHLRIVPALLGWKDPGAAASAVIQLGTLLAVILYFSGDIVKMTVAWFRGLATRRPLEDPESKRAWMIIIGSIPVGVLGLLLKDFIETSARNLWIIATMLVVLAILLGVAERYIRGREHRSMREMGFADAIWIGLGQCLALVPGSSRSGSTIMTGLFRKLDHETAARFSFLLGIPAIAASGLFELLDQWKHLSEVGFVSIGVAVFVSFVTGWISIWFLLRFLRSHTTWVFVGYRVALGVLIAGLLLAGVLQPI